MSPRFVDPRGEAPWVRRLLIGAALVFLALFLAVPLAAVFVQAFAKGWATYVAAVRDPAALAAVRLTLLVAAIVVPVNTLFGLAAAWGVTRFRFRGRDLLVTLIDLPFSVSPVVSGLLFVLLFGARGWLGPWLTDHGVRVLFALPGIVLATLFVTSPFVARQLIPLMEAQGQAEEQAALTLGARGWQLFAWISLPKVRWGLLYGVVLTSARAMGEFGAVSVVSGHIRGRTNTIPLHVEILYNEYQFAAAFAVATLLTATALATLAAQALLARRLRRPGVR
ncbi:MAG: sulfate ABC transporter permease subunit CysW [Acidobacteria bacterium]|nr:sulfate ABC transporter permease subunit CysW [Acidobacteriota bacterium]